jgi:phage protein D
MALDREQMIEPAYEVYFNGNKLHPNLKKYITLVEFEESDSEADVARITVSDVDLIFANSVGLTKKMPFRLDMGYKNNLRTMLIGEVSHIEADFGEEGIPQITIGAIDNSNKMTTQKKSRKWKSVKASAVVTQIAREYGFTPVVQTTETTIDEITQEEETDAQLIVKLADDEAFQFYVVPEQNKLYFTERVGQISSTDTVYYNSGDHTVRYFRPNFVEKKKADNTSSTEGDVSDTTGDSVNSTATASNPNGTTQQSTGQYSIDTVNGDLQRVR